MELVRSPEFATDLAASINGNADLPASVTPAGLSFNSLGYIVLYDEDQVGRVCGCSLSVNWRGVRAMACS